MSAKLLRFAKVLGLVVVGFVLGTVFGLREGQFAFYVIDAPPKGVLSMGTLKAIEKDNLAPAKIHLNTDIDHGLYLYSIARDKWWYPLFKMGVMHGSYSYNTEYVTRLAKYRKLNPAPNEDPTIFDKVPEGKEEYADAYVEMAATHRERLARIRSVIEEHSAK
jgi:hypothetical protein